MFDRTTNDNGDPTERTPLSGDTATVRDENDTVYNDSPTGMTRARRIARYLSEYSWYFPKQPRPDVSNLEDATDSDFKYPNLDVAWAYFEHIGLPRCFTERDKVTRTYNRAEPGETTDETMLYPVWSTPLVDMGDFGVGIGLYFFTVRFFAVITFIAGLINIPAILYLYSDDYDNNNKDNNDGNDNFENENTLLKMSAVCTNTRWEPCPSCHPESGEDARFAFGEASDGSRLTFIRVNDCSIDGPFGMSTYISLLFVIGAVYAMNYFKATKESNFDKAVQTSTDYSIKIKNPPPTAMDPEDWRKFFEHKFNVTVNVCTVVLDNADLLRALIHRRRLLNKLHNMLPRGQTVQPDDLDGTAELCPPLPPWKKIVCCAKSPRRIVDDVRRTDDEIVALAKEPRYDVSNVFVTFGTEDAQRTVLKKLIVPRLRESQLDDNYRYEGTVLRVLEPDEPDSIHWPDLDVTIFRRIVQQTGTLLASICIIVLASYLIKWADIRGPASASLVIVACNLLAPHVVRLLTSFESHRNESLRTASQYYKITMFRWSFTVFVPLLITPFINVLNDDAIIENIKILFIAEMIQRPILQTVNIVGLLKRHVLGPRAQDQRQMNLLYSGDKYHIAERYTDITKVLLLTVFYCVLYPMAFFFASVIFSIYYWVDKFLILRSWKQGPMIGTAVSNLSMVFFKFCLFAYAVMASYIFYQLPYDDACPSDIGAEDLSAYRGDIQVTTAQYGEVKEETLWNVTATRGYRFCNEQIRPTHFLPPLSWEVISNTSWMDGSQKTYAYVFGWTSMGVLVLVFTSLVYRLCMTFVYPLFFKFYKPPAYDVQTRFREVTDIAAYVPQVTVPGFPFPFLLCDTENIQEDHVGWRDPQHGFDVHDLTKDVPAILARRGIRRDGEADAPPMFSVVKEWDDRGRSASFLAARSTPIDGVGCDGLMSPSEDE